jgi:hypothetical protein
MMPAPPTGVPARLRLRSFQSRSACEGAARILVSTACPRPGTVTCPKIEDLDEGSGRFTFDMRYRLKQPDWTYSDVADG